MTSFDDRLVRELLEEHYRTPHNRGELADPDVAGEARNPACVGPGHERGDHIRLEAAVDDGTVTDVAFDGEGCTLATAAASMLTDEMRGASTDDVASWDDETIRETVGVDLPPARLQCAELALVAFRDGLETADGE